MRKKWSFWFFCLLFSKSNIEYSHQLFSYWANLLVISTFWLIQHTFTKHAILSHHFLILTCVVYVFCTAAIGHYGKTSDFLMDIQTIYLRISFQKHRNVFCLATNKSLSILGCLIGSSPCITGFALHGSFSNHFLIGQNSSTANQNLWNKQLLELPWRRKCLLPCERA